MKLFEEMVSLTPVPPFDFGKTLAFLRGFPLTRGENAIADNMLTRAVEIEGQVVVFRVTAEGTVEGPRLACVLWSDTTITDAIREAVRDRIAFHLSIADDLAPFYAIGQDDPPFVPVIAQLYGYHQVKFLTPFENAAWAILSQRRPMATARKTRQALIERYGGILTVRGVTYRAFPTAARLATTNPDDLLTVVPNLRKAPYLHAVARAFDDMDEIWLRTAPYDEVEAWLRRIPGIGAWSAAFILIRGLGRMETSTTEDALLRAATNVYGPTAGTATGLTELARRYGPHQGYWARYLRAYG